MADTCPYSIVPGVHGMGYARCTYQLTDGDVPKLPQLASKRILLDCLNDGYEVRSLPCALPPQRPNMRLPMFAIGKHG